MMLEKKKGHVLSITEPYSHTSLEEETRAIEKNFNVLIKELFNSEREAEIYLKRVGFSMPPDPL